MKKHLIMAGSLILLLLSLTACSSKSSGAYQKLSPEKAKEMMDSEKSVMIVDVRTKEEYEEKHITDAILIPNETIGDTDPQELTDKDAPILVYCRSGVRSKQAAEKLINLGYTQIYDIGGITTWPYENFSSGLPKS